MLNKDDIDEVYQAWRDTRPSNALSVADYEKIKLLAALAQFVKITETRTTE